MAPEISLTLSDKDKIDYYRIDIDDDMVAKQKEALCNRFGVQQPVEEASEKDIVKGQFVGGMREKKKKKKKMKKAPTKRRPMKTRKTMKKKEKKNTKKKKDKKKKAVKTILPKKGAFR